MFIFLQIHIVLCSQSARVFNLRPWACTMEHEELGENLVSVTCILKHRADFQIVVTRSGKGKKVPWF